MSGEGEGASPAVSPVTTLAATLAEVHATAFDGETGAAWDAAAFAALLELPGVRVEAEDGGFILIRTVVDEAEVLTLAVRPQARRRGLGLKLVAAGARAARAAGADRLFLEVADDNAAARALYARAGFVESGLRRAYYARPDGARRDAVVMTRDLRGSLP